MNRKNVGRSAWAGARSVVAGMVLACAAGPAPAQPCGGELTRLVGAPPRFDARLGQVIAMSADGSTLAAGAHWDRVGSENRAGTVSVWRRGPSGRSGAVRLQASDAAANDEFGCSVALSADGGTLAVGAFLDDRPGVDDAGAVYVFVRSGETWTEQAKLIGGSTGFFGQDYFGGDLAISADGNTLAVGAPRWDQGGFSDEGAVHVFTRSGSAWTEAALLRSSFGRSGDNLGDSVSISADGTVIAAGAGNDDTDVAPLLLNAGSVAIFRKAGPGWAQEVKLFAPDATAQERFGFEVALSGDGQTLAVGMPFDTTGAGAIAGSVRTYAYSGAWTPFTGPSASAAGAGLQLGFGVTLSHDGSVMTVGSFDDTVAGQIGAGSAYVFDRAGPGWSERARLLPPTPEISGHFGIATAQAEDGTIAVGEYRADVGSEIDAGAVWVAGPGCAVDLNCDGVADFADYLEFLNLYDAQDPAVDFNQDGVVDFADYLEFLNLYEAGC